MTPKCGGTEFGAWRLPVALLLLLAAASRAAVAGETPDGGQIRVLLVPQQEATLSSQIAARIDAMPVATGGRFRKGAPLVRFNCAIKRAKLKKAKAQLKAASMTLQANQRLRKFNSVSALQLAVSETEVDKARADVALAQAETRRCTILAPMPGRVVKRLAKPFESVAEGQPLLEILDDSALKLQLFVPSRWLVWLAGSTPFTVTIDETGKDYPATVTSLGARVDPVSQTLEISGRISGRHPELLAGMSGTAHFRVPAGPSKTTP